MSRTRSESKSRSRSPTKRRSGSPPAEQENDCPFLIRLFITKGKHTPMIEFDEGKLPVKDEFQVYGWKTSTPSSLIQLLYPSFPSTYRSPLSRFSFRHIYVDASPRGLYRHKDLVSFTGRDLMSSSSGSSSSSETKPVSMDMELDDAPISKDRREMGKKIEEKTLDEYGFVIGDLISVSLHVPEPRVSLNVRGAAGGISGSNTTGFGVGGGKGPRGSIGAVQNGREAPVPSAPSDREWIKGEALTSGGNRGGSGWNRNSNGNLRDGDTRGSRRESGYRRGSPRDRDGDRERIGDREGRGGRERSRSRSPSRRESWASRRAARD